MCVTKSIGGKMKTFRICLILSMCFILCQCSSDPKVKGDVKDKFTRKPIDGATVIASTRTNIEEDKKYEKSKSTSDINGEFILKKLSSKYSYSIEASKNGYWTTGIGRAYVTPNKEGKTLIIERPLELIKKKHVKGKISEWPSGEPISGVSVRAETKHQASFCSQGFKFRSGETNDKGIFSLEPLCPGLWYSIQFSKQGYAKDSTKFRTNGDKEFAGNFSLTKFPANKGVFLVSHGDYKQIGRFNPEWIKFNKLEVRTVGSKSSVGFYYIKKNRIINTPSFDISKTTALAFNNGIDIHKCFLGKLTYHNEFFNRYYLTGWAMKREKRGALKDKDIYLLGNPIVKMFPAIGGNYFGNRKHTIKPGYKYNNEEKRKLAIIKVSNLDKGIYGLYGWGKDFDGEVYIFELK